MRKEWKRNQNSNNSFKVQIVPDLCVRVCCVLSHVRLCDPRDCSPPGSSVHGFPRQEHRGGVPCPYRGDPSNPETKPTSPISPALQVGSSPSEPSGKPNLQWSNLWFYDAFRNPTSNGEFWSFPGLVTRGPKDPLALTDSSKPQFPKDNWGRWLAITMVNDPYPYNHSIFHFHSVQFNHSVVSDSLRPHELQHARPHFH